ncbi:cyclic-di-AMP receptor [Natranaerobius trueperi]|uniref:Transcriptional regulator n=1 Tax=Natranaerobius trueperi TaxID=759412 RepID=A0A226BXA5_9FIRM|nr:cyclic-di-AMP receptor [Natranaerobius trueperi]OWZ83636.1 hypothetical protein CDO51_07390 [Natranaerobius trueperi]
MKLVIVILQDKDAPLLLDALNEKGVQATKLASSGGFLRSGNTTLLIGVSKEKVHEVIDSVKEHCSSRKQMVNPVSPVGGTTDSYLPFPVEVTVGGATIFVVDVENFEQV